MSAGPAIRLSDVEKSFGSTRIIQGATLDVLDGERHAIIGPNGAGKSTLFNLISGQLVPTAGRIELRGRDITGLAAYKINRMGLSRSFQITTLFHRLSVVENIRCALYYPMGYRYSFWRLCPRLKDVHERADEVLERLELTKRRDVLAGMLSYAEQRALEIGLTVAGGADVILLDEPTAGMSRSETARAVELIRALSENKTLLMVEHDMSVVFELADRVSVLLYGEVIATGTPNEIKDNPQVQEAYLGAEVA